MREKSLTALGRRRTARCAAGRPGGWRRRARSARRADRVAPTNDAPTIHSSVAVLAVELVDDLAARQHDDSVGEPGQLGRVRRVEHHGETLVGGGPQEPVDVHARPHVDALRRLLDEQHRRLGGEHPADGATFCWFPPDSDVIGCSRLADADAVAGDPRPAWRSSVAAQRRPRCQATSTPTVRFSRTLRAASSDSVAPVAAESQRLGGATACSYGCTGGPDDDGRRRWS